MKVARCAAEEKQKLCTLSRIIIHRLTYCQGQLCDFSALLCFCQCLGVEIKIR